MHEPIANDNRSTDANDGRLQSEVVDAISRSEPIRAVGLRTIRAEVRGGTAILRGRVPSVAQKFVAGRLAASVPGIEKVENGLTIDEEIEGKIALALAANEATSHLRFSVRVFEDFAVLYGAVDDEAAAAAVVSVAREAADGLEIRSNLRIVPPGSHALLLWQNSLEGRQMVERAAPAEPATDNEAPVASPVGEVA